MKKLVSVVVWRAGALLALVLGLIGIVVPGLPTVPFLLVAAWAAGKGWPALERWLLEHPRHGAAIRRWRERGAVPRRAKVAATAMMLASAGVLFLSGAVMWVKVGVPATMAVVAAWLWCRPED